MNIPATSNVAPLLSVYPKAGSLAFPGARQHHVRAEADYEGIVKNFTLVGCKMAAIIKPLEVCATTFRLTLLGFRWLLTLR